MMVNYIARFRATMKDGETRTFKVRGVGPGVVIYDCEVPAVVDGVRVFHNLENRSMSPRGFFRRTGWRMAK